MNVDLDKALEVCSRQTIRPTIKVISGLAHHYPSVNVKALTDLGCAGASPTCRNGDSQMTIRHANLQDAFIQWNT